MIRVLLFFWRLYQSDDRPQARAFTIGLFLATLVLIGLVIAWISRSPG